MSVRVELGRWAGALALCVALSAGLAVADFYEGQQAFERGDFEAARRQWLPLAQAGDSESQYRIGRMLYHGQVEGGDAEAVRWYRQAAERGHAAAQNNLGLAHEQGRGVEPDLAAAASWYRRAAEQGLSTAQANLARALDLGRGVAEDPGQAALWYERAARQKHAPSQFRLGQMFAEGRGVELDAKKAAKWFERAANGGHPAAAEALSALSYRSFAAQAGSWPAAAAAEAGELAGEPRTAPPPAAPPDPVSLDVLREKAEGGDAEAQFELGRLHATGDGVALSVEEAARWYLAAAEGGHAMAAYTMGFHYYRGRGVTHDLMQAHRWFDVAAERGVGDAEYWRDQVEKRLTKKQRQAVATPQD